MTPIRRPDQRDRRGRPDCGGWLDPGGPVRDPGGQLDPDGPPEPDGQLDPDGPPEPDGRPGSGGQVGPDGRPGSGRWAVIGAVSCGACAAVVSVRSQPTEGLVPPRCSTRSRVVGRCSGSAAMHGSTSARTCGETPSRLGP